MSTESWYELGVGVLLVGAALTAFFLHFITAPYGRHYRGGFGPDMDARMSWVVMESPAVLVFGLVYFRGAQAWDLVPLVLFGLWQAHYLQRTFVFPFLMRLGRKRSPLLTVALGLLFNTINGAVNAVALSHGPVRLTTAWLWVSSFLVGRFAVWTRLRDQSPVRRCAPEPATAGGDRIPHAPRWTVPVGDQPQLPGRDDRVDRVGPGELESRGSGLCLLHGSQSGPAGPGASSLVSREVSRLSAAAEGARSWYFLRRASCPAGGSEREDLVPDPLELRAPDADPLTTAGQQGLDRPEIQRSGGPDVSPQTPRFGGISGQGSGGILSDGAVGHAERLSGGDTLAHGVSGADGGLQRRPALGWVDRDGIQNLPHDGQHLSGRL